MTLEDVIKKRKHLLNKPSTKPKRHYSDKERDEYYKICKTRVKEGINHPKVKSALQRVLKQHPDTREVYLGGSFVKGSWVDENTPKEFKALRYKITKKTKLSDVDLYLIPKQKNSIGEIHINSHPLDGQKKIYEI